MLKVSNGAKIRNRYNQVPHLTQDTNGKVTNSQKTPQTRAKRSALSQQVTTKHIYKSPQEMEYDVTMKTRTNLCRNIGVHTKPLNGVSIRKNVSCGSFYNTETEKCTTLIEMYYSHSFQLFIFHIWKSYFHFQFSFGTRTAHQ